MIILKPVVWNDNGYTWPAGIPATSGYSQDHGYGHEEWNGRSDWVWENWKVFHTEAKGQMHDYAASGSLGIIMTTMRNKRFYAVGVGCNIYENSESDKVAISAALGLQNYADRLWEVPAIQERKARRADLDRHWRDHMHVNWRCPQSHFAWFGTPIEIVPNDLIPASPPRQAIAKMHGSYQAVRPDQALAIVEQSLAPRHPVIGWLSTNDFDPVRNRRVRDARGPRGGGQRSSSTPSDPMIRYMQEQELVVTPRHHLLQNDFAKHLKAIGARSIQADIGRVDLRYIDKANCPVLVEVKPTEPSTVRYAIRLAMGQLLDYHQRADGSPAMLIVVDDPPQKEDAELALANGFGIAWRTHTGFLSRWPGH